MPGGNDERNGALIGAGASILGNAMNWFGSGNMNKKNREWQESMYDRQRANALSDWNMQNAYNSPQSQMERLKSAGLNPNLVYGNGVTTTAGDVRSTASPQYKGEAPKFDFQALGQVMSQYYSLQMQKKQIDLLEVQKSVAEAERMLKISTRNSVEQSTRRSEFDLGLESELRNTSLEFRKGQVSKQSADTQYTIDQNIRAAAQNSASLQETAVRIASIKAQTANTYAEYDRIQETIKNLRTDNRLKESELRLREKGLSWSDNIVVRALAGAITSADYNQVIKNIQSFVHELVTPKPEDKKRPWNFHWNPYKR